MASTRRDLAATSATLGVAIGAAGVTLGPILAQPAPALTPDRRFLTEAEYAFVEAVADRILPADRDSPGGRDAGVAVFIDAQLAGPWGQGGGFYAAAPHQAGTPRQGYQLPFTPAALYRAAIPATEAQVARLHSGRRFAELPAAEQDAVLTALEAGRLDLTPADARAFFALLRANCIEGYFSDPVHGGNRDMAGWRMLGFPGAYAAYWFEVELHNVEYTREPAGIATINEACAKLPIQPAAGAATRQQPATGTGGRG